MSSERFSVKMRASARGEHVSGAERIVPEGEIPRTLVALADRALHHAKGRPDFINLKLEAPGPVLELEALPVSTETVSTPEEGWRLVGELLAGEGFKRAEAIKRLFRQTYQMRGAMLLHVDTLERLEPDRARGVRATYMDQTGPVQPSAGKSHFREALVLATKVASAPGIVGEICMSDDPDYVTGYVATKRLGYKRITVLKRPGDPAGGRIFLYRGRKRDVPKTIRFLERQAVLVRGVETPRVDAWTQLKAELKARKSECLDRSLPSARSGLAQFAANDYLGLAKEFGGSTGSRLLTGNTPAHQALERELARFKGAEAALVYATGYMANLGVISALAGKEDVIFSDELNHASIIDGCRLSGARVVVYRHLDMADLDAKLAEFAGRRRLVVSDGVFSMDGDLLPLPDFLAVCRRHGALAMVDEAHANGVVGRTGRGLAEHFGCDAADVTVGTLSKAFGAEGGFVTGRQLLIDYLVNKSRSFIFSTAPSVPSVERALAAVQRLEKSPSLVARLKRNVTYFADLLRAGGVPADDTTAIFPVFVGDEALARQKSAELAAKGLEVSAIRYPTVPRGAARLRVAVSADHTKPELRKLARALCR